MLKAVSVASVVGVFLFFLLPLAVLVVGPASRRRPNRSGGTVFRVGGGVVDRCRVNKKKIKKKRKKKKEKKMESHRRICGQKK